MAWSDIKTSGVSKDPKIQERRKIGRIIINLLHKNLPTKDRFSVFQMNIDKFLLLMYEQHHIPPSEVLVTLIQQPDLLKAIYRNKFKEVKDRLLQEDQTSVKEKTFVTLFYDRYGACKSFFRAVIQTYKYPFEDFSPTFVTGMFVKYPFLRKQSHLKHVVYLLERAGSAYYLTQDGIKEEYDRESILSHMGS
jgi:hypothetical protein